MPLYSAPRIAWLAPRRTKNVPMIEAMMQTPPMASGNVIICITISVDTEPKKMAASTMVATDVTA
jgi:hypothetical protein